MNKCRLCSTEAALQASHIIPQFAFRWLVRSSPTHGLRGLKVPNRRLQDGPTREFLCLSCEQMFAKWEGKFAARIFLPLHLNECRSFAYEAWGLKFAASVVWRVLAESMEHGQGCLTAKQLEATIAAEEAWRLFILDSREHPGEFEVHAVPLDINCVTAEGKATAFLNRYLLRAIDAEVIVGPKDVLVYAKLCRILLVGHVTVHDQSRWRCSQISLSRGILEYDVRYYLPSGVQQYMKPERKVGCRRA